MNCYCCHREVSVTRKVDLRGDVTTPPAGFSSPEDPAYLAYRENTTYRAAFVCPACYELLDGPLGVGEINGQVFGIVGRSRGRKAPVYRRAKYEAFRRKAAVDLGLDPD